MASIEEALRAAVTADSDLWTLIGGRMWAAVPPESAKFPLVVMSRVSGDRVHSLTGPSGLARPRFQFTIYSVDDSGFARVREIASRLRRRLDGYQTTHGDVRVYGIVLDDERETAEQLENVTFYRVDLDFVVLHSEE